MTLGPDSIDLSRELGEVIDRDRTVAFEQELRDKFALKQKQLQEEAIEQIAEQTQLVVHESSENLASRRAHLATEWDEHVLESELAVQSVEAHSASLMQEVEALLQG